MYYYLLTEKVLIFYITHEVLFKFKILTVSFGVLTPLGGLLGGSAMLILTLKGFV